MASDLFYQGAGSGIRVKARGPTTRPVALAQQVAVCQIYGTRRAALIDWNDLSGRNDWSSACIAAVVRVKLIADVRNIASCDFESGLLV